MPGSGKPKNASTLLHLIDVETGQKGSKSISNILSVEDGDRGRQSHHFLELVVRVRVYLRIFRDNWTQNHKFPNVVRINFLKF